MPNFESPNESSQASLPEVLETSRIHEMQPGDKVYAYGEALGVDEQRRCWLNNQAHATAGLESGMSLCITKNEDGDLHVHVVKPDSTWTPRPGEGFEDTDWRGVEITWLPVTKLTFSHEKRRVVENTGFTRAVRKLVDADTSSQE